MYSKIFHFITIFFLLFSNSAFSQEENMKGRFNIGVLGGPQFTNIDDINPDYQMISKTGYSIGAIGEYFINNDLKLRIGAYFDNRKYEKYINTPFVAEIKEDSTIYIGYNSFYLYQVDFSLNYLTIPISVVYQKGNEKVKVFVQFGFYYSFLLNATQHGSSDLYINPIDAPHFENPEWTEGNHITSYEGSVKDNYNQSDFGINFYIGGWFKITEKISATISPGLTYGISQVFVNPKIDATWGSTFKIDAGIIYQLNKMK